MRDKDRRDMGDMRRTHANKGFAVLALTAVFTACVLVAAAGAALARSAAPVKKPVFAGSFYPADSVSLQTVVDGYLRDAERVGDVPPGVFAVIAPHAGYIYSGKTAAYSYNAARGKGITTVILLGPSHRSSFSGIALYPSGTWETPLGKVPVDTAMGRKMASLCGAVKDNPGAFDEEHSLEVQLPFLQRTLKDFKIVPLLTGAVERKDVETLSDSLATILKQHRGKVLLVVSSDMSHYHTYSEAVRMDSSTLRFVADLDAAGLIDGLAKRQNELCGATAVVASMMAAAKLGAQAQVLHYTNSGDTAGDRTKVVGYGSVAFWQPDGKASSPLAAAEKKRLLAIARKTSRNTSHQRPSPTSTSGSRGSSKEGVFVTLTIHRQLRGCIGYIKPVAPLYRSVVEMTVAASSRDMRFPPVTKGELKDITIEISVMSPLKLIASVDEIKVGTHGLYIVKGGSTGLLLPQVATQYKWGREEFLQNTCAKAGLPENAWKDRETKVYVFSAQVFSE
jgi:AmmeMemoRadiSam system protein B/AmmeMemoRadiSam system protein A